MTEGGGKGLRVTDGLAILINQGVIGVKYWTGVDADRGIMRTRLEEIFGG
jgi:shikimate dehydrogenase